MVLAGRGGFRLTALPPPPGLAIPVAGYPGQPAVRPAERASPRSASRNPLGAGGQCPLSSP